MRELLTRLGRKAAFSLLLGLALLGNASAQTSASSSISYVRDPQGTVLRIIKIAADGTRTELLPLLGPNGSVMAVMDESGNIVEELEHDAYGVPDSPSSQLSHTYRGEYWDQDSQLLYLRARWYDPSVGRFISADPFEGKQKDPQSLNRYAYAHSDPVHGTDPSGKMTAMELGMAVAVGGALNAAIQYETGQSKETIAKNFLVGSATSVVAGGVFSVAANLLKAGRFAKFPSSLQNLAILNRVGLKGPLFPGRTILSEQMTMKVGEHVVLLQSNAIKMSGAAKHFPEILGKGATAGQTTLAETVMLQEAEAAIHAAVKQGLADTAFMNTLSQGYAQRMANIYVQTPGFNWEIAAQVVNQGGQRLIKVFHMLPLR